MKVLTIGSDRNLFKEDSAARRRIIEYGNLADELHIIVFTKSEDFKSQKLGNVFLYPTNSRSRWFYIPDAYKLGKKIIGNSYGNMLITGQDPFESGLVCYLLARKLKIPLQLQIHTDFFSPYFGKESILNKVRILIAKFLIVRADCLRVVSERIKNSLKNKIDNLKVEPVVLPIFVDVKKIINTPVKEDLHKKYPQFDFIILMASRLTGEKNIGLAISAMAEIIRIYPKTGLIIVGDGLEEKKLEAVSYKLKNNIIFENWVDDLVSYYKTADLFMLTSNYEGYGMAVIEAMAAGCPVIMTDVGLAGETLIDKKDGVIIPIGDKEKLGEAIINLIRNPELRKSLIDNSKKTISFWPTKENYLKSYREAWLACRN